MNNDNLRMLYNAASKKFDGLGSEQEFAEAMTHEENRKAFHEQASPYFNDLGTLDQFNRALGFLPKDNSVSYVQQRTMAAPQPGQYQQGVTAQPYQYQQPVAQQQPVQARSGASLPNEVAPASGSDYGTSQMLQDQQRMQQPGYVPQRSVDFDAHQVGQMDPQQKQQAVNNQLLEEANQRVAFSEIIQPVIDQNAAELMSYIQQGGDPTLAYAMAKNPLYQAEQVLNNLDEDRLTQYIQKVYGQDLGSMSEVQQKQVRDAVAQQIESFVIDDYMRKNQIKGDGQYILQSAVRNSLAGKIGRALGNAIAGEQSRRLEEIEDNIIGAYSQNLEKQGILKQWAVNGAIGAGTIALDAPFFAMFDMPIAWFRGLHGAKYLFNTTTQAPKLLGSAISQGINWGLYGMTGTVADRAANTYINDQGKVVTKGMEYDENGQQVEVERPLTFGNFLKDTAGSFGEEFTKGALMGSFFHLKSPFARKGSMFRQAATGTLSFGLEGALLTGMSAGTEMLKGAKLDSNDIASMLGENYAMIGFSRLNPTHMLAAVDRWNASNVRPEYLDLLNTKGYSSAHVLQMLARSGKTAEMDQASLDAFKADYEKLMSDSTIPLRLRLQFREVVEGKTPSDIAIPRTASIRAVEMLGGKWVVETLDTSGQVTDFTVVRSQEEAQSIIESNRIQAEIENTNLDMLETSLGSIGLVNQAADAALVLESVNQALVDPTARVYTLQELAEARWAQQQGIATPEQQQILKQVSSTAFKSYKALRDYNVREAAKRAAKAILGYNNYVKVKEAVETERQNRNPEQQALVDEYRKQLEAIISENEQQMDAYTEAVATAVQNAMSEVNDLSNTTTGELITATTYESDEPVHITGGNIVTDAEGNIDFEASSKHVVVRDADGNRRMMDIRDIASVESRMTAEEYRKQVEDAAKAEQARKIAEETERKVEAAEEQNKADEEVEKQVEAAATEETEGAEASTKDGKRYKYYDAEDNEYEGEIVDRTPDGKVRFRTNDGREMSLYEDQLEAIPGSEAPKTEAAAPKVVAPEEKSPFELPKKGNDFDEATGIPVDETGNPVLSELEPQSAIDYLNDVLGLDRDSQIEYVLNKMTEADEKSSEIMRKMPKMGTNPAEYKKLNDAWEKAVDAWDKEYRHYNDMYKALMGEDYFPSNEDGSPNLTTEQQLADARAKREKMPLAKRLREVGRVLVEESPSNVTEGAAWAVARGFKVDPESMKNELGSNFGQLGKEGLLKFTKKGAGTLDQVAHEVWQAMGSKPDIDPIDIKNEIIGFIMDGGSRKAVEYLEHAAGIDAARPEDDPNFWTPQRQRDYNASTSPYEIGFNPGAHSDLVSKEDSDLIGTMAKQWGIPVVAATPDEMPKLEGARGFYDKATNTIYLNVANKSGKHARWIMGHEITHKIKDGNPAKYDALVTAMRDYLGDRYNSELERMSKLYGKLMDDQNITDPEARKAYVEEEMVSDLAGDLLDRDTDFARKVMEEAQKDSDYAVMHLGLVRDTINFLRDVMRSFSHLFDPADADRLYDTRRAWEDCYREAVKVNGAKGIKFSLEEPVEDNSIKDTVKPEEVEQSNREAEIMGGVLHDEKGHSFAVVDNSGNITPKYCLETATDFQDNLGEWHKGTHDTVLDYMRSKGYSKKQVKAMDEKMSWWENYMRSISDFQNEDGSFRFEAFREWNQRTPEYKSIGQRMEKALTSLINNGEYPINLELTTDCIKREAFTQLLNEMVTIDDGRAIRNMNPAEITAIQDMMKTYGIQTACPLCFVEGKRLGIRNWAERIVHDWNCQLNDALDLGVEKVKVPLAKKGEFYYAIDADAVAEAIEKKFGTTDSRFNFGQGDYVSETSLDAMSDMTERQRQAKLINDTFDLLSGRRGGLLPDDLQTIEANAKAVEQKLLELENDWYQKNPDKPYQMTAKDAELIAKMQNDGIKTVAGRMAQTISQYPELRKVLTINDLIGSTGLDAIRTRNGEGFERLFSHIVSRFGAGTPKVVQRAEPYVGEILSLGNEKIDAANKIGGSRLFSFSDFDITKVFDIMQIFFDAEARGLKLQSYSKEVPYILMFGRGTGAKINMSTLVEAKPLEADIEAYRNAKNDKERREIKHRIEEYAGLSRDENGNISGFQWSGTHSVSPEFAEAIYRNPDYNANCGATTVGVSVNHTIYSCLTPWIRQVIPFHLSGMPIAARERTDVGWYRDATSEQNTRAVAANGKATAISHKDDFDFYAGEDQKGWDMRDRCRKYVLWCYNRGYIPRFEWCLNSDGYIKFCEDNGYTPDKQILEGMRANEHTVLVTDENGKKNYVKMFDGYYKVITDFNCYKPEFDADGNFIGEKNAPHGKIKADFVKDEQMLGAIFTDEDSMLQNRENNIRNANDQVTDLAYKAIKMLKGEMTLDEAKNPSSEAFRNAEDAEKYLQGVKEGRFSLDDTSDKYMDDMRSFVDNAEDLDDMQKKDLSEKIDKINKGIKADTQRTDDIVKRGYVGDLGNSARITKMKMDATDQMIANADQMNLTFDGVSARLERERMQRRLDHIVEKMDEAGLKRTKLDIKDGEVLSNEIADLFHSLNTDEDSAALFDRVREAADALGVSYSFYPLDHGDQGSIMGVTNLGHITYSTSAMNSEYIPDASKARTLLHEMLHGISAYAFEMHRQHPDTWGGAFTPAQRIELNRAIDDIKAVYEQMQSDPAFAMEYGKTAYFESFAEMANPRFREKLQKMNLWERFVDGMKRLFKFMLNPTDKATTGYEKMMKALDSIIDNQDARFFHWVDSNYGHFTDETNIADLYPSVKRSRENADIKRTNGKDIGIDDRRFAIEDPSLIEHKEYMLKNQYEEDANKDNIEKELSEISERVGSWADEIDNVRGLTREQIFEKYDNDPQAIAFVPEEYLKYLGDNISDNRIYSGMAYFLDHGANRHPNATKEDYARMQDILNTPESLKMVDGSLAFIKHYDKYNAMMVSVEATPDGKIVWHKSLYKQTKEPYKSYKDVRLSQENPLEVGTTSVSPAEDTAAAISRIHGLNGQDKDTANSPEIQENKQKNSIDDADFTANAIKSAESEVNTDPTEAQKKAGNYKMGHVKVGGYDVTIENPKGSVRRGTDASGKAWETPMNNTYGYIRGTEGVDGDHIDIFLSDTPEEGKVYVVDQVDPETGKFDEHKVMFGFNSADEARKAYLSNYTKGWKGLGNITEVSKDEFKSWINSSHRKTKPFADYSISRGKAAEAKAGFIGEPGSYQDLNTGCDEADKKRSMMKFNAALPENLRKQIVSEMRSSGSYDIAAATLKHLADLAEARDNSPIWKDVAKAMSDVYGVKLSEGEAKYMAWRTYRNENPSDYSRTGKLAEDYAMRLHCGLLGENPTPPGGGGRRDQTESKEFKSWFGKSKVVDESGKPLAVYHGTADKDLNRFDGNAWFTSSAESAEGYRQQRTEEAGGEGAVKKTYLSMQKPFIVDAEGKPWNEIAYDYEVYDEAKDKSITFNSKEEALRYIKENNLSEDDMRVSGIWDTNEIAKYAKEHGYDGAIIKNVYDPAVETDKTQDDYVVFDGRQVKSATDNNGSFDPANPDIRYSLDNPTFEEKKEIVKKSVSEGTEYSPLSQLGAMRQNELYNNRHKIRYSLDEATGPGLGTDDRTPEQKAMDSLMEDLRRYNDELRAIEDANVIVGYNDNTPTGRTRVQERPRAVEISNKLRDFVRNRLSPITAKHVGPFATDRILRFLNAARTKKDLEPIVREIQKTISQAEIAAEIEEMDKVIKTKTQSLTPKGLAKGVLVDSDTHMLLEQIRGSYRDLLLTSKDDELIAINKQLRDLKAKYMLDSFYDPNAPQEFKDELAPLMEQRDKLQKERNEIMKGNVNATVADLENRENEINGLISDAIERGEEPSKELLSELISVPIRKRLAEVRQMQQDLKDIRQDQDNLDTRTSAGRAEWERLDREYMITQRRIVAQTKGITAELKDLISEGRSKRAEMLNADIERQKHIIHIAFEALHGFTPLDPLDKSQRTPGENFIEDLKKVAVKLNSPVASLDFILRFVDHNNPSGEGDFYDFFMKSDEGAVQSRDRYTQGLREYNQSLADKALELFGDPDKTYKNEDKRKAAALKAWKDLINDSRKTLKDSPIHLSFWTGEGQRYTNERYMNKGQMLNTWLTWRQEAGKVKLQGQGFDEAAMRQIEGYLGDKWLKFGEWVTEEFFPRLREEKYNPEYEKVYGTSLHRAAHYFPLNIDKGAIHDSDEIGEVKQKNMPSSASKHEIVRSQNRLPIDLSQNALDVMLKYGQDMERTTAYAMFTKNLNVLVHSLGFGKMLDAQVEGLYKRFKAAAAVATESYQPDLNDATDFWGKLHSSFMQQAISLRIYSAVKQTLSYPAFGIYSGDKDFQKRFYGYVFTPRKNWKWAMENLEGFKSREETGDFGQELLKADSVFDWLRADKPHSNKVTQAIANVATWYRNNGMWFNKSIDGLTVAAGARAVYDYDYKRFKAEGMSHEEADKKAKVNATIAFNQSQQSSRPEFSSPIQKDKDLLSRSVTAFQSSNIAYHKIAIDGVKDMVEGNKAGDKATAVRGLMKILNVGLLNGLWWAGLNPATLYGWLSGNSTDEEQEEAKDALLTNLAIGYLANGTVAGPAVNAWLDSETDYQPLQVFSQINTAVKNSRKALKDDNYGTVAMIATDYLAQAAGVNISTFNSMFESVANPIARGKVKADDILSFINLSKTNRKQFQAMDTDKTFPEYMDDYFDAARMHYIPEEPNAFVEQVRSVYNKAVEGKDKGAVMKMFIKYSEPEYDSVFTALNNEAKAIDQEAKVRFEEQKLKGKSGDKVAKAKEQIMFEIIEEHFPDEDLRNYFKRWYLNQDYSYDQSDGKKVKASSRKMESHLFKAAIDAAKAYNPKSEDSKGSQGTRSKATEAANNIVWHRHLELKNFHSAVSEDSWKRFLDGYVEPPVEDVEDETED